jgi:hypothetical protein
MHKHDKVPFTLRGETDWVPFMPPISKADVPDWVRFIPKSDGTRASFKPIPNVGGVRFAQPEVEAIRVSFTLKADVVQFPLKRAFGLHLPAFTSSTEAEEGRGEVESLAIQG